MKEQLADGNIVTIEGDIVAPDNSDLLDSTLPGIPIEELPYEDEEDIEIDDTPEFTERALIEAIAFKLLEAHDEYELSNEPSIHSRTRQQHRDKARMLREEADALIVELPSFDPGEDRDRAIIMVRAHIREQALAARRATEQAAALGRVAAPRELDWRERAAGEGVKRPYDDD